jgi:hypothetical protein
MIGRYDGAMKPAACLLVCLSLSVPARAASPDNPVEQRRASLQQRGAEALNRERARGKAHLFEAGPDPVVANCWVQEGKTTDADYTAYVRAIGALLRLPPAKRQTGGAAGRTAQAPRTRCRRGRLAHLSTARLRRHDDPMGRRNALPGRLPEVLGHGDLGPHERTGRPLRRSLVR